MSIQDLTSIVIDALDDLKGQEIKTLDVTGHCDFTDIMVFCTGTSSRHVKSLANSVIIKVKEHGFKPLGLEGEEESEWVLVDLGDVVVHIMQPQTRELYQLEALWSIKPKATQESNET